LSAGRLTAAAFTPPRAAAYASVDFARRNPPTAATDLTDGYPVAAGAIPQLLGLEAGDAAPHVLGHLVQRAEAALLVEGLADVDAGDAEQLAQNVVRLHLDSLSARLQRLVHGSADLVLAEELVGAALGALGRVPGPDGRLLPVQVHEVLADERGLLRGQAGHVLGRDPRRTPSLNCAHAPVGILHGVQLRTVR
jgi:hypothetical protein